MNNPFSMAVPKKRTSISKKHIRKNIWKKKGYWAALKALSIGKSLYCDKSTLSKSNNFGRVINLLEIQTI